MVDAYGTLTLYGLNFEFRGFVPQPFITSNLTLRNYGTNSTIESRFYNDIPVYYNFKKKNRQLYIKLSPDPSYKVAVEEEHPDLERI